MKISNPRLINWLDARDIDPTQVTLEEFRASIQLNYMFSINDLAIKYKEEKQTKVIDQEEFEKFLEVNNYGADLMECSNCNKTFKYSDPEVCETNDDVFCHPDCKDEYYPD